MNPRVKAVLTQVLPPIVVEAGKRMRQLARPRQSVPEIDPAPSPTAGLRTLFAPEPPEWEAVPDNEEVWTAHAGWSHQSIAETQRAKWPAFLASVEGKRPFGWSHEAPPGAPIDVSAHNTIITFGHVLGC